MKVSQEEEFRNSKAETPSAFSRETTSISLIKTIE
jgi:hypothetical protein